MSLFNTYWFRWFAGAFLLGASVVAAAKASNKFKDLKIESVSGRVAFTDTSAWVFVGLMLGLFGGLIGLGAGAVAKLSNR